MTLGTAQIIQGNALNLPLPDSSVDLVCTSPPYFGLRSYQDGGAHYAGQIGSEATPTEFLDALIAATAEMVRVLKPTGSLFVNLGDKYAGPNNPRNGRSASALGNSENWKATLQTGYRPLDAGVPNKSLMGIPWRYAIACIDELGLILRAEIIWNKPNGLPESVTDRVRRSHEQWFHFTVQPRYFAAVDEIREAHSASSLDRYRYSDNEHRGSYVDHSQDGQVGKHQKANPLGNSLGKLPGSVWTVPTQPLEVPAELGVDHFAAYPMEWPRRIIQGWTPTGICVVCGEGRRPVGRTELDDTRPPARRNTFLPDVTKAGQGNNGDGSALWGQWTRRVITGYMCGCSTADAPTRPAVVLDPFMGTGTTLVVARALGRNSIGVDLSADYCRLAQWRINNPQQLAAALQIEKPELIPADQLSLFEDGMT